MAAGHEIFELKLNKVETKGLNFRVIPETIVDTEMSLKGDFFSGFLDQKACQIIRVPERTRILGEIVELDRPSSFSRGARIKVHVSKLLLFDGTTVEVSADFSSKSSMQDDENPTALKSFGRKLVQDTTQISASTLVGAVDVIQYTGIGTAIATSGISTLVGAGLGFGMGLLGTVKNKGEELTSSGFEPINLKLESDFIFLEDLPIMAEPLAIVSTELLGFDISVNQISKYKSADYGEYLLLDIKLSNKSPKDFFLGDFVLSSPRHIIPVFTNPLIASSGLTKLGQDKCGSVKLAFSLGLIRERDNYQLMMLNPVTQEIIANTQIDIASYL